MLPSLSYSYERSMRERGYVCVAGVDEVGAGALAGDVYAAAVVLRIGTRLRDVQDSKRMTVLSRERWARVVKDRAYAWAIGSASVAEIDSLNVRQASFLAMRRALACIHDIDGVLCDGFVIPDISLHCQRVIHGDALVKSIAAASIIAKVERDSYMRLLHETYPMYGFDRHKGYGTALHRDAIRAHGMSSVHRVSFCKRVI